MRTVRLAALCMLLISLILQGCEDDPILEPTIDTSGGGSYGNMRPLSGPRAVNPRTF